VTVKQSKTYHRRVEVLQKHGELEQLALAGNAKKLTLANEIF